MTFRVLDPVGRPRAAEDAIQLAARLDDLRGRKLGVLINEGGSALATNWEGISLRLQSELERTYGIDVAMREVKPNMSEPATADLLRRFARGCDGVINGLGK